MISPQMQVRVQEILGYECRGWRVPEHMAEGLARYLVHGVIPGDFLKAVLEGDLFEATGRADDINMRMLPAYAFYLYNKAPIGSYGTPAAVAYFSAKMRGEKNGE